MESNKIIIAGYYQSFTYAYWLYYHLNYILGNTVLYRPETDSRIIINSPERSCLVVFSFFATPPTPSIWRKVQRKGAPCHSGYRFCCIPNNRVCRYGYCYKFRKPFFFFRIGMVALSIANMILYEVSDKVKPEDPNFDSYHFVIKEGK